MKKNMLLIGLLILLSGAQGSTRAETPDQWNPISVTETGQPIEQLEFSDDNEVLQSSSEEENPSTSPDGQILVTLNSQQIILQQAGDDTQQQFVVSGGAPLRFSPDGSLLAYTGDRYTVVIGDVAKIIAQTEDPVLLRLSGHTAPITDLAFSPDGNTFASASRDGSISLWDATSGKELAVLMGHNGEVSRIAFNADGTQLASGGSDGRIVVWGAGEAETLEFEALSPTTTQPDPSVEGVIGYAQTDLNAGYQPSRLLGCEIAKDAPLLAVGISNEGAYLVYTPACEGAFWIAPDADSIEWTDESRLAELSNIESDDASPLLRLADYDQRCADAGGVGQLAAGQYTAYPADFLPMQAQADVASGVDVLICHSYPTVVIENCHYLGPGNYSYIYTRVRTDDLIKLVDYQSGAIIDQQRFEGGEAPFCPEEVTRARVYGAAPTPDVWLPWVLESLGYADSLPLRTSITASSQAVYTTPDDAAEVLTQLPRGTTLSPIAQDASGQWVAAVLPDLSKGWLPVEALQPAAGIDLASLPNINATFAKSSESEVFNNPLEYRPLGRFYVSAYDTTLSPDGYYVVAIESDAENYLSLWSIRGGRRLWRVALGDWEWQTFGFTADGKIVYLQTTHPYPAEEEVRLTFFEAQSGQMISSTSLAAREETEGPELFDIALIPGDMPQPITVSATYTADGRYAILNYQRHAEAPHCAVWEIATARLVWEKFVSCGSTSSDGQYMIIPRPYTEIHSSYSQLVVYEVATGRELTTAPDEAAAYAWLDAAYVLIHRPYGNLPVIWDVFQNQRAVMDLPAPLGEFYPTTVGNVLYYVAVGTTYVWDIETGKLLAQFDLEGQLVQQPKRVLLLQGRDYWSNPPEDYAPSDLIAIDLASNQEVWRIPWQDAFLTVSSDGLRGLAYNVVTYELDLLDLENGQKIGSLPLSYYVFYLTPNWDWLIQSDGFTYTVWGQADQLDLFQDPPTAQTLALVQPYYEANNRFPSDTQLPEATYLWLTYRSADGEWVNGTDISGYSYWLPITDVKIDIPVESLPIYPY